MSQNNRYISVMKTNSINWVNGTYYLAKKASNLSDLVGGSGPFGYLTMREIAQQAAEMRNNQWVGYWESPRKALACTFRAVRLSRLMPFLFIPVTYVDILALGSQAEYESGSSRLAYVSSTEGHYGRVETGSPLFVKLLGALNAPLIRMHDCDSPECVVNPSDNLESVMIHRLDDSVDLSNGYATKVSDDWGWDRVDVELHDVQQ